jgi:small conductance mechanosensitive channel
MPRLTAPSAAPSSPALDLDSLFAGIESFVTGALSLDPEQAAIRGGLTLLVGIGAMLLIWGLRVLYKALTEWIAPEHAENLGKKQMPLGRWALRIARVAIVVAALLTVLRLWGLDIDDLRQGPLGEALAAATRIAFILVIAFAALELAQLAITRMFARIAARARNPRRAAQVRTLAPLVTGIVTTTLIIMAAMMALSEVGVEIGPLIAGAGIIGLAIGFGAQTLVKDFLTGIFLILEDIVSVGDTVMIQDFGGVVEEMSLRTIKLRDFDGTLHVFPYSEAQVIHNRTKGFSFAVFELSVDHGTDLARALDLMRDTAEGLRTDPAFAEAHIDSPEISGVERFTETGILLKGRVRTSPGKQWVVRREFLWRIKAAFDEAGIVTPVATFKMLSDDKSG